MSILAVRQISVPPLTGTSPPNRYDLADAMPSLGRHHRVDCHHDFYGSTPVDSPVGVGLITLGWRRLVDDVSADKGTESL